MVRSMMVLGILALVVVSSVSAQRQEDPRMAELRVRFEVARVAVSSVFQPKIRVLEDEFAVALARIGREEEAALEQLAGQLGQVQRQQAARAAREKAEVAAKATADALAAYRDKDPAELAKRAEAAEKAAEETAKKLEEAKKAATEARAKAPLPAPSPAPSPSPAASPSPAPPLPTVGPEAPPAKP